MLPVVAHQVDPADARVRRGELLDPLPARVVAPVVHEHDLVVASPSSTAATRSTSGESVPAPL